jgi:hypothetical protein
MFRHFNVIIREFTTNALLSYTVLIIAAVDNRVDKIKLPDNDIEMSKHVAV